MALNAGGVETIRDLIPDIPPLDLMLAVCGDGEELPLPCNMKGSSSLLLTGALYSLGANALNNGLALRPPLGWNSWNSFACNVNETVILDTAQRIVDLGFKDLGYEYVVLDDCWSSGRNSSGYLVPDETKFPNGIAHVADKIHELGLKFGIYSSAGTMTCAYYSGSLGYEQKDADVWASWGIDYLKYDNCFNEGQEGTPKLSYDRYAAMSKALNATGRPIVYAMCNWGVDGPWNFATTIANSWRTSGDLSNVWNRDDANCPCSEKEGLDCKLPGYHCSILNVLNMAAWTPSKAYEGAWNDLDLLQIGNGGLTDDESISHFSLWAAVKSPLLMSNALTTITTTDPQTLSILQNPAVLAVSQDPQTSPAVRRWRIPLPDDDDDDTDPSGKTGELQLYSGPLAGGDQLVLLLNAGSTARAMNASLVDVFWDEGVKGTAAQVGRSWDVYDLWGARTENNQTAPGVVRGGGGNVTAAYNLTELGGARKVYSEVPPSGSRMLMGTRVGSVGPSGTVQAMVRPHGVAMLRLREREHDEL